MTTLLERFRQGESTVVEEIVERYGPAAYAIAASIVDDREQAERVTAGGFSLTLELCNRFDPARDDEQRWILSVVRRHALGEFREGGRRLRRRRRREQDDQELEAGVTTSMPSGIEADAVIGAFRALRPSQREALSLAGLQGLDPAEIGRRTGVSEAGARGRIRTGLIDLMDQLGGGGQP